MQFKSYDHFPAVVGVVVCVIAHNPRCCYIGTVSRKESLASLREAGHKQGFSRATWWTQRCRCKVLHQGARCSWSHQHFLLILPPPLLSKKANRTGGDYWKKRTMEEDSPLLLKEDIKTADVTARVGTVARSLLLALLAAICFSSMSFCVAGASTSMPPLQLVFINGVCMFVASVILLLLLKRERTYELCPAKKLCLIITR